MLVLNTLLRKEKFEILIHSEKSPISAREIKFYLNKIIKRLSKIRNFYWSIAVVDDKKMRKLNYKFKGHRASTDVISFLYDFNGNSFAEIIISATQAYKNAEKFKTKPKAEVLLYLIHGILHLIGYNDSSFENKKIMSHKQSKILKELSV